MLNTSLPSDTNNKSQLVFGRNVEIAMILSLTLQPNKVLLLVSVFLDIFLSTLKNQSLFSGAGLRNINVD